MRRHDNGKATALAHGAASLLAAILLATAGCGGDQATVAVPAGPSLRDQITAAQQETDPAVRAAQLMRIAYSQYQAQDAAGADQTLTMASKACDEVDAKDPPSRVGSYSLLAKAYMAVGNKNAAKKAVSRAQEAAGKLEPGEAQLYALGKFAEAQGAVGDPIGGQTTLQSAEGKLAEVADPEGQLLVRIALARSYQKIQLAADADRVLAEALKQTEQFDKPRERCKALSSVAAGMNSLGKTEQAEQTFQQALELARGLQDPLSKGYSLTEIAQKLAEAGQAPRAQTLLAEAEQVANTVPEVDQQRLLIEKCRSLMNQLR